VVSVQKLGYSEFQRKIPEKNVEGGEMTQALYAYMNNKKKKKNVEIVSVDNSIKVLFYK
jgi:hypothetical protein